MQNGKRFEDWDTAAEWISTTFQAWSESLSDDERDALRIYKGTEGERINEAIRADFDLDDDSNDIVEHLDLALARFRIPEPIIVHRGSDVTELRDLAVGFEVIEYGFLSTSLMPQVARSFVESLPAEMQILSEILVPGGANIGAYAGAPDLIRHLGEFEILLPRETRLRIVRQSPDAVEMEVIT